MWQHLNNLPVCSAVFVISPPLSLLTQSCSLVIKQTGKLSDPSLAQPRMRGEESGGEEMMVGQGRGGECDNRDWTRSHSDISHVIGKIYVR